MNPKKIVPVYGTHKTSEREWRSPYEFDSATEAVEIMNFFGKGHAWLVCNKAKTLVEMTEITGETTPSRPKKRPLQKKNR